MRWRVFSVLAVLIVGLRALALLTLPAQQLDAATSTQSTATRIRDLQESSYTLIPLEEGNYSDVPYATAGGDAAGDVLFYSGSGAYPEAMVFVDRASGLRHTIFVRAASNEAVRLTGDGSRLFLLGSFPGPLNTFAFGFGFLDLATQLPTFIDPHGADLFSPSATGQRAAYQGTAADQSLQYFLYDEARGTQQLTSDPNAITYFTHPDWCPDLLGSRPFISADGSTIVLLTSATLGVVPADPSVACYVFAYDVDQASWRLVTTLPAATFFDVDVPTLSADGQWFSFITVHLLPGGGSHGFAELLDVQTGALHDPVLDVGNFTTFDSVVTGNGQGVVISTEADLDPRVGNADHNLELFYYDLASGAVSQITDTTAGIGSTPNGCPSYRPYVNDDGSVVMLQGFFRDSIDPCQLDGVQRNAADGFWFRFVHAVRKRPGNQGPILTPIPDLQVVAGMTLTATFTATDPDGDPITFFAQVPGGVDVLPGSVITDHHDGTAAFAWPTQAGQAGTYVLRVAAFDEGGGEVFQDVHIAVLADTPTPTATALASPTPTPIACLGDCNGDGQVTVAELVTAIDIALGTASVAECPAIACHGAGAVSIDCLIHAVVDGLNGCP